MTSAPERPLVVGLDGSAGSDTALRWGGEEAARGGLPLLLVRSYSAPVSATPHCVPGPAWIGDDGAQAEAQREVDLALTTIDQSFPLVHARGRVVRGEIQDAVLTLAKRADTVIVAGDRHMLRVGSLVEPLTKRSAAPVVVIPPDSAAPREGEVLVGLTLGSDTHSVLAYVFEHARRHSAAVRVVCCWPPRRIALSREATLTFRETEELLFDTLAIWRQIYPDVRLSSSVVAAHPTAQLIVDSEHARLLVIGGQSRPGADWALRRRIHRLLRWTRRPVAVVPKSVNAAR